MTTGRPVLPAYFIDTSGRPVEGVTVTVYVADPDIPFVDLDVDTIADVLDLATVYTDETGTTEGDNPFVTADANVWPIVAVGDYVLETGGVLLPFSSVRSGDDIVWTNAVTGVERAKVYVTESGSLVLTGAYVVDGEELLREVISIERDPGDDPNDLNVRRCVYNIGEFQGAGALAVSMISLAPVGDTTPVLLVKVAGSNVNNALIISRGGYIDSNGYGLTSRYYGIKAVLDITYRFRLIESGESVALSWGPGGVAAADTNLYRSAADVLATDDDLECATVGKGVILKSPDGTRYRLTVANGGALSAVAV